MNRFSISQMASYSGLTAFTIRAWEKRYHALNPGRSDGNTRFYTGHQLKRLLNITSLLGPENKPSDLCVLDDERLNDLVAAKQGSPEEGTEAYFIAQLVAAGLGFEEQHFSRLLSRCLLRFSVRDAYLRVIYPMLTRIGLLWRCDRLGIAQEHFVSQLLKQKLMTEINMLPLPEHNTGGWLLLLPEDEFHELGLLIAHYLIRRSGQRSVCLGANVPMEAIGEAVSLIRPDAVFLQKVVNRKELDNTFLQELVKVTGSCSLYIAGLSAEIEPKPGWNIHAVHSVEDLEALL